MAIAVLATTRTVLTRPRITSSSVVDNISWTHGSHSIKFGADIDRTDFNVTGSQYLRAQYGVQNQATGYTPSDFMLGYVNSTSDAVALAVARFGQTSQAYYFQDSWKIRPNITISYGLRYEYVPAYSDKAPLANIWIPPGAFTQSDPNGSPAIHPSLLSARNRRFLTV